MNSNLGVQFKHDKNDCNAHLCFSFDTSKKDIILK